MSLSRADRSGRELDGSLGDRSAIDLNRDSGRATAEPFEGTQRET
jgi:hypothetical protein